MNERKLASVRRILNLEPIEGADKILKATVDGWQLVTAKDNGFEIGDLCIYLEIDSWVPTEIAPFLSKGHEPREFNGIKGERLKTIKLRGQVSQGLIIPLDKLDGGVITAGVNFFYNGSYANEGDDLTETLGIQKWEKPIHPSLAGKARGNFPSFIHKTDQERCQNLIKEIGNSFFSEEEFEVTEKIDGSSMTVYRFFEHSDLASCKIGVCSRNLDLKLDQEGNAFVNMAYNSGIIDALEKLGRNIAVQGELYGESIQGNNEGIVGNKFAVFDIFDIDRQVYLTPHERWIMFSHLVEYGAQIQHVPIISDNFKLNSNDINDLLKMAEAKNSAGNEREGLVFKSLTRDFSFKAISNKFLLGGGD